MKIRTAAGIVTLKDPAEEQLMDVGRYLPLAGPLPGKPGGADYGIVMKQGGRELMAVKQQVVDFSEDQLQDACTNHLALVILALKGYRDLGFTGVLMPSVYVRPKAGRKMEVGVAYFGAAAPLDAPAAKRRSPARDDEDPSGKFTEMVAGFINSMLVASKRTGIQIPAIIGLDYRPRSALGTLWFSFLVHGRELYSLKISPSHQDPAWEVLRTSGIREAWAIPCVPLEIPEGKPA